MTSSSSSSPPCFVCSGEEGSLYRVCACRDALVHEDCFRDLVTRVPSHAEQCAVCRTPYAAVKRRTRVVWGKRVTYDHPLLLLYCQLLAAWVLVGTLLVGSHTSNVKSLAMQTVLYASVCFYATVVTGATLVAHALRLLHTRRLCCVQCTHTEEEVTVGPLEEERERENKEKEHGEDDEGTGVEMV
jgi:hypothetical protein